MYYMKYSEYLNRHFSKDDIQMTNIWKDNEYHYPLEKCKFCFKTTVEYPYIPIRMATIRKTGYSSTDIAVEQIQLLNLCWWRIWNGTANLENSLVRRNTSIYLCIVLYMNVFTSFPCSVMFFKTTQLSIIRWMDKHCVFSLF